MIIRRTANAGVLLQMDGISLLLDGVRQEVTPYLATPRQERQALLETPPDAVLFTHKHADHYDAGFLSAYLQKTAGPVIGPADIPHCAQEAVTLGTVRITPVSSRHIGKKEPMEHMSFIIQGSRCVWFPGDASPLQWQGKQLPKPDVLIGPYAYAIGSGWEITKKLGTGALVLLHLPEKDNDPYGLWTQVENTVKGQDGPKVYIPAIGENECI